MQKIMLNNEVKIPVLGIEVNKCEVLSFYNAIRWALKLGIYRFDLSGVCGKNDEIVKAFYGAKVEDDVKREDLFFELSVCNGEKCNVKEEFEEYLNKFEISYADVCYLRKSDGKALESENSVRDFELKERWKVLEELYRNGKCLAIGLEGVELSEIKEIFEESTISPMICRIKRNPLEKNEEVVKWLLQNNVAVEVMALKKEEEIKILENNVLNEIAKDMGTLVNSLCLALNLKDNLAVNIGFDEENVLRENLKAFELKLDEKTLEKIKNLEK